MIKEIEELYKERAYVYDDKIHSKDKGWNEAIQHYDNIGKLLNDIELKLQRLDSIDNANPSEALECVEDLIFNFSVDEYVDRYDNNLQVIKQALLKAEQYKKKAMAWDVFIKKRVWISKLRKLLLKHRDKSSQQQLEIYNSYVSCHIKLEDLELFKELFKK